jgi:ribosomal-protein-alanine N-acetyltransferase
MNLKIKILKKNDVTQSYVDWFDNKDVVRYSENQYRSFSIAGQRSYVSLCLKDPNTDLYGIFDNNLHIGNIIIKGLNSFHKRAEISYIIGNTKYWGKGVGFFAVSSIIEIAKNNYNLTKLFASTAEKNIGSRKILEKNGFVIEGKRKQHLFYNNQYHNQIDYGLILKNFT